jgi:Domain of unknown function (DUF1844)
VADDSVNGDLEEKNAGDYAHIPGSASSAHPNAGIPLPAHGFDRLDELDELPIRELADIPAVEVISRAAVMLMSASAEKLGLAPGGLPAIDLDEARRLITTLAGLVAASQDFLGIHRQPLRDGVRTLQAAFREASSYPDEPGEGPGEKYLK